MGTDARVLAASSLRQAGADDADVRLFLTFTAAVDRARDSTQLFMRSAATWLEPRTRWVFSPDRVTGRSYRKLFSTLKSVGVTQRHGSDAGSWHRIAHSLVEDDAASDVRTAIMQGTGDVLVLDTSVQRIDATGRSLFPQLRGPKIRVMWIRMLVEPGGATLANVERLPVAVDVQVRTVSEYLGVTDTWGAGPMDSRMRVRIQRAWAAEVAEGGSNGPKALRGTAAALDPALWFVGSRHCSSCERAGRALRPLSVCARCRASDLRSWPTSGP